MKRYMIFLPKTKFLRPLIGYDTVCITVKCVSVRNRLGSQQARFATGLVSNGLGSQWKCAL